MLFAALLFFSFWSAGKALAVNTGTIGVLPAYPDSNVQYSSSWLMYNLDLGQSRQDAVRVINNEDETAVIKIYAVDATVTNSGGFALLPENSDKKDVGSWVKLSVDQIEVPPKSEKLVPFVITIPQNADAGDHAGGIVVQQVENQNQSLSGTGVKIISRVGVRIYETVPGAVIKGFNILRFDWQSDKEENAGFWKKLIGMDKKTSFFLGIENTGNIKISPKVSVEVKNIFGRVAGKMENSEVGDVFPRTKTSDSAVIWNGMPFLGRYNATLRVDAGNEIPVQTKNITIWAFPIQLAVELFFFFIFLALIRLIHQYIRESKKEGMPIYTVEDGDTLPDIAEGLFIKWKKIAVVNGIKKPYHLSIDQKIFLPINNKNYELLKQMYRSKMLELPIRERFDSPRKSRKKLIVISIIFAIILAGSGIYYFKNRKPNPVPNAQTQNASKPQESDTQTTRGVVKKSSIKVGICTPKGFDIQSSQKLQKKLQLIGYQASLVSSACSRNYSFTTVEYLPGKSQQADIVKIDLGLGEQVDEKEVAGLDAEILINNQAGKDEFLDINNSTDEVSLARELIKIKFLKAGISDADLNKLENAISAGGYSIQGADSASGQSSGLTIEYQNASQKSAADNLKDFLSQNGYTAKVSQNGNFSSDFISVLSGKLQ